MSRASNKQAQEQSRLRNEHIEGEFRPDSSTLERHSRAGRAWLPLPIRRVSKCARVHPARER